VCDFFQNDYFLTGIAVLGIALIAMGEDIGGEMAFRAFGHLVSSSFRPLTTV
jgi:hypothetical protein